MSAITSVAQSCIFIWRKLKVAEWLIIKGCHRQGDPSCTYLETCACGMPIVGYNNQAHHGILASNNAGWAVKMNDIKGMADLIISLNNRRDEIKTKSLNAACFAREHTFEATFERRISHCVQVLHRQPS